MVKVSRMGIRKRKAKAEAIRVFMMIPVHSLRILFLCRASASGDRVLFRIRTPSSLPGDGSFSGSGMTSCSFQRLFIDQYSRSLLILFSALNMMAMMAIMISDIRMAAAESFW